MTNPNIAALRTFLRIACLTIIGVLITAIPTPHPRHSSRVLAESQSDQSSAQPGSVELEEFLFVQAPEYDNGKGGIVLI